MTFQRRLKLFIIGLGLGTVLSYFFVGERWSLDWAFGGRVHKRLHSTLVKAAPSAEAQLGSAGIALATLRDSIHRFDVGFWRTRRTDDSLFYALTGDVDGRPLELTVAVLRDYRRDSTATLLEFRVTP